LSTRCITLVRALKCFGIKEKPIAMIFLYQIQIALRLLVAQATSGGQRLEIERVKLAGQIKPINLTTKILVVKRYCFENYS